MRPKDPNAQAAADAGLLYVSDEEPGIARKRAGQGFAYFTPAGKRVRDAATLARIRMLAIPPAYTDVWICRRPRGHLQATGRDARRRKQYRYHPRWSETRGDGKYERVIAFGEALPKLRRRLGADLKRSGHPREKVLAIVVALMADTLARVGNDAYARDNGSFGLTTLRNRHAQFIGSGRVRLKFRGKSGQAQDIAIDDARLAKLVRGVQQLPGQLLFQYVDDDGKRQPVDSGAVNAYLREALGESFTAKDFRTWGGTLLAFKAFAGAAVETEDGAAPSERALAALEKAVVKDVAQALGNTVAVCRKAYIDPAVPAGWRDGSLQRAASGASGARQWERATLRFLKRAKRAAKPRTTRPAPTRRTVGAT